MNRSFIFGERAVISLFRGAGGLLGLSGSGGISGIDALNGQLQSRFQDYFWSSQVFDSYEGNIFNFSEVGSQQALGFVNQFDRVAALGAVGYSAGGLSAIRLAEGLAPGAFNLLVQIDSFVPLTGASGEDQVLPGNVAKGINYFQVANRFNLFRPGFDPFDLQGATVVQGSENINVESLFGDRGITHRTIVNDPRVQDQILQDIETHVLQDLKFDREGQLSLTGGAQLKNNILSLAPGLDGVVGTAFIAEELAVAPDFSFQTRFEFRLPPADITPSSGFSFWLQPAGNQPEQALSSLSITFEPFTLQTESTGLGAIALLTPGFSPTPLMQVNTGLNLASGNPLTAWIDYDGTTDQLSVFLADTLIQPSAPLLTYGLNLPDIVGSRALAGFQTTTQAGEGRADLLTWDFTATGEEVLLPPCDVVRPPFDYNGDGKVDFLLSRPASGSREIGWLMDELTSAAQVVVDTINPEWQLFDLNVFNGGGKANLSFANETTKQVCGWLMDGATAITTGMIAAYDDAEALTGWQPPFWVPAIAPLLGALPDLK